VTREGSSRGGKSTVERHGVEHMKAIGSKGFAATVARHWQGDKQGYLQHLRAQAWEKGVGGFVDRLLKEQLDSGKEVACVELPVINDPEDYPW
jgi:hypothetical protein